MAGPRLVDLVLTGPIILEGEVAVATGSAIHDLVAAVPRVVITPSAAIDFTGIANPVEGRAIYVRNQGAFAITFKHSNAGSVAANRLRTPASLDFRLANRETVQLIYEDLLWTVVASPYGTQLRAPTVNIDLAADVNNLDPGDWDVVRINPTVSGIDITGIAGGYDGRVLQIVNVSSGVSFLLQNDSGSSDASNRFRTPGGAANVPYRIGPYEGVTVVYAGSRWRFPAIQGHFDTLGNINFGSGAISKAASRSIAGAATVALDTILSGAGTGIGLLFVSYGGGHSAIFALTGGNNLTYLFAQSGAYSATLDAAGSVNIAWSAALGKYVIQNNGATNTFSFFYLGHASF